MLRGYQADLQARCYTAWEAGARNIIPVMPTGGGKTAVMSHIAADNRDEYGIALAHRSVLVGQLSIALARAGVPHDIVASKAVIRSVVSQQIEELGRSFYNPSARWKVASVDTLPGRVDLLRSWMKKVTMGFTDEAHHVLKENKWGRACQEFQHPDMRWLLPTATPERADGKGLGAHADGIADTIVAGPAMRWLIEQGYLSDYTIRAPLPSDLNLTEVQVSSGGDYNQKQLRQAVHASRKIVGVVVDTYLRHTPGMLGIGFAVDIEHAGMLCQEFNAKGVRAEVITAEHSEEDRRAILRRYRKRETLVMLNVDLFGEGFDLPAIEVVMMARPTASYSLYAQQFGRGLRVGGVPPDVLAQWEQIGATGRLAAIAAGTKPRAYIHDHVGNVLHFFGPPDKPREMSLDRRTKGKARQSDAIPMRTCLNAECMAPYERYLPACPYCGMEPPPPVAAAMPDQVDGDITLYTSDMLERLFGVHTVEQALAVKPDAFCRIPTNLPSMAAARAVQANHARKMEAQAELAKLMPLVMPPGLGDRAAMRRFFLSYGVDVVQARLLGGADTVRLIEKIKGSLK